jgi:hypothetical protein
MDQQDVAYNHPGVPLDRGIYDAFAATFEDPIRIQGSTSTIECATDDSSPIMEDCANAMIAPLYNPGMGSLRGKKDGQWWSGVSNLYFLFFIR